MSSTPIVPAGCLLCNMLFFLQPAAAPSPSSILLLSQMARATELDSAVVLRGATLALSDLRLPAALLQRIPVKQAAGRCPPSAVLPDDDDVYFCGSGAYSSTHSPAKPTPGVSAETRHFEEMGVKIRSMQQQLRNISLVCKKWRQLTQKAPFHILWQCVCLEGVRHAHAAVLKLCTAAGNFQKSACSRFKTSRQSWHDGDTSKDVTSRVITTFDGTGCIGLTDDAVGSLCACARERDEEESHFRTGARTKVVMSAQAGLRHVSLVGCTYISDVSLSHLACHGSSLGSYFVACVASSVRNRCLLRIASHRIVWYATICFCLFVILFCYTPRQRAFIQDISRG
jgi:hypothetical protein